MALSYLHEQQILHRDLALRNVLVKTPSHVMLADFGSMKQLSVRTSKSLPDHSPAAVSRFVALATSYSSVNAELELPFRSDCCSFPHGWSLTLDAAFRWSAPESLLRSRFSKESDIW